MSNLKIFRDGANKINFKSNILFNRFRKQRLKKLKRLSMILQRVKAAKSKLQRIQSLQILLNNLLELQTRETFFKINSIRKTIFKKTRLSNENKLRSQLINKTQ